jgi:hypothetical protein
MVAMPSTGTLIGYVVLALAVTGSAADALGADASLALPEVTVTARPVTPEWKKWNPYGGSTRVEEDKRRFIQRLERIHLPLRDSIGQYDEAVFVTGTVDTQVARTVAGKEVAAIRLGQVKLHWLERFALSDREITSLAQIAGSPRSLTTGVICLPL